MTDRRALAVAGVAFLGVLPLLSPIAAAGSLTEQERLYRYGTCVSKLQDKGLASEAAFGFCGCLVAHLDSDLSESEIALLREGKEDSSGELGRKLEGIMDSCGTESARTSPAPQTSAARPPHSVFAFLAGLLLFSVAFQVLIVVTRSPLHFLMALLSSVVGFHPHPRSGFLNQLFLSLVYGGLLAVLTRLFLSATESNVFVYGGFGLVFTFVLLSDSAANKQQQLPQILDQVPFELHEHIYGTASGAALGVLVGSGAYLLFFFLPGVVLLIPGVDQGLQRTISLSQWLNQFWLVRAFVALSLLGYLFVVGLASVAGAATMIANGWQGARRVFGGAAAEKWH